MSPLERFSKWIQLKIYQIEVTYSVYMFTPIEKFVFYSILFLLFSLTSIAAVLYLPQHLSFILNRAWFYANGDGLEAVATASGSAGAALKNGVAAAATMVREL